MDELIAAPLWVFQFDLIKLPDSALWWGLTLTSATNGGVAQRPGHVRCPSYWLADKGLSVRMSQGKRTTTITKKKKILMAISIFHLQAWRGRRGSSPSSSFTRWWCGAMGVCQRGGRTTTANYWKIPLFLHYAYCVCSRLRPSLAPDTAGLPHAPQIAGH